MAEILTYLTLLVAIVVGIAIYIRHKRQMKREHDWAAAEQERAQFQRMASARAKLRSVPTPREAVLKQATRATAPKGE